MFAFMSRFPIETLLVLCITPLLISQTTCADHLIFSETNTQRIFISNVSRTGKIKATKFLEISQVGKISCLDATYKLTKKINFEGTTVIKKTPSLYIASNYQNIIAKMQIDGSNYKVVRRFNSKDAGISSLVVDPYSELIYYSNNALNTISVMNTDGLYHKDLIRLDNNTKVHTLKVAPSHGLMFWSSLGQRSSIERANMDGSDRKTIISGGILSPWGITLDEKKLRVIWGDRKTYKIESAYFNGTDRRTIVDSRANNQSLMVQPYSIALRGRHIIWSDWMTGKILMAKLTKYFPYEQTEPVTVTEMMSSIFDRPGGVVYLSEDSLNIKDTSKYPCSKLGVHVAQCQQLCLPIPSGNYYDSDSGSTWWKEVTTTKKCACQDDLEPTDQGRCVLSGSNPEPITEWDPSDDEVMFVSDTSIGSLMIVSLDPTRTQSYKPLPVATFTAEAAFDYDPVNKTVYWIDQYTPINDYIKNRTALAYAALSIINNNSSSYLYFGRYLAIKAMNINATSQGEERVIKKFSGLVNEPVAMAIDYKSRLIYFSDNQMLTISVMDMMEFKDKIIISNLPNPALCLAVAPEEGLIFWLEHGKHSRIMSAWGDGSHMKVLVENKFDMPFELVVDHQAKMLYWTDTWHNAIQRMSFDGTHRSIVIKGPSAMGSLVQTQKNYMKHTYLFQPLGIALDANNLYWTDGITNALYALPKDVIPADGIYDSNGVDLNLAWTNPNWGSIYKVGPQVFRRPYRMKVGSSGTRPSSNRQMDTACSQNQGKECSHLCLPLPGQTKVCKCPNGMLRKEVGSKTLCSYGENEFAPPYGIENRAARIAKSKAFKQYAKSSPFLYFADPLEPSLVVINLNDPEVYFDVFDNLVTEPPLITKNDYEYTYQSEPQNFFIARAKNIKPSPISVDYDHVNEKFYFVDIVDNSIKAMSMNATSVEPLAKFFSYARISSIYVDPYTDLIYYIDAQNNIVGQLTKDGRLQRDLFKLNDYKITSLQIDSIDGYIYWAQWNEKGGMITKAHMDGTLPRTILQAGLKEPISLTFDLFSNRLYWIDMELNNIGSCDKYGKGAGILMSFDGGYLEPFHLAVSSTHMYWTDRDKMNVFNVSKDYLEIHKISEYGVRPKYVTLAQEFLSKYETDEKFTVETKYAPEQTLRVGIEVQIMPVLSFLTSANLKVFNGTPANGNTKYKAAFKSCPKLGPRSHVKSVRAVKTAHLSQRYGGCSDFCYPVPDSDRICGCSDQEGIMVTLEFNGTNNAIGEPGAHPLNMQEIEEQFYVYYETHLSPHNVRRGNQLNKIIEASVLLDDKLTCNRSLICPNSGINREEIFKKMNGQYDGMTMTTCQTGAAIGDKCSFECLPGYMSVSGLITRECQDDGKWSGELLRCQPIKCDKLESPVNSKIISCPGLYNTSCEFECDGDSIYDSGSLVRTCMDTGTWSGTSLKCKRKLCQFPPPITNDNSNVILREGVPPSTPGSTCRVGCKGADDQNALLTCMEDGTWSQPDYTIFKCFGAPTVLEDEKNKYRCPYPLLDASNNAMVHSCVRNPKPGDICHFSCEFPLVPYAGSSSVICQEDGTWSQPFLVCRALSCQAPTSPYNSLRISCSDRNHLVDSRCSYKCNPGYHKIDGDATRQCLANGEWSGEELLCSKCPPLPQPSLGLLECFLDGQSINCRVKCDNGAILLGNEVANIHNSQSDTSSTFVCDRTKRMWLPDRSHIPSCSVLVQPKKLVIKGTITNAKKIPESVSAQQGCSSIIGYDSLDNDLRMPSSADDNLFDKCAHLEQLTCISRQVLVKRQCLTQDKTVLNFTEAERSNYNNYPKYFAHIYNFSIFVTRSNHSGSEYKIFDGHEDIMKADDPRDLLNVLLDLSNVSIASDAGMFNLQEVSFNVTCEPGHIVVGQACAGCPEGTRKALDLDLCLPCPPGYYQDMYAQEDCKRCPDNQVSYGEKASLCETWSSTQQKLYSRNTESQKFVKGISYVIAILLFGVCMVYHEALKNFFRRKRGKKDTTANNHQPFGNGTENKGPNGTAAIGAWTKFGFGEKVRSTVIKMKNYRNSDAPPHAIVTDSEMPYLKFGKPT